MVSLSRTLRRLLFLTCGRNSYSARNSNIQFVRFDAVVSFNRMLRMLLVFSLWA